MKKNYLCAAVMAAMLASCSTDVLEGQQTVATKSDPAIPGETPVVFSAYTERGISRGGYDGELTTAVLKDVGNPGGFGVFAYYTDSKSYSADSKINFMYNQQVTYAPTEGKWIYEPVKYWPNEYGDKAESTDEDKVTFFAYAPYVEATDVTKGTVADATWGITGLTKNSATGDPIVKYIADFTGEHQVDLCWATADPAANVSWETIQNGTQTIAKGMPWIDVEHPNAIDQQMKFYFNHALAQLNVQIDADVDDVAHNETNKIGLKADGNVENEGTTYTKVYVRSITFGGIAQKGALNLNNTEVGAGKANWINYSGEGQLETTEFTINDGRKDGKEGTTANNSEKNGDILNSVIISNPGNTTAGVTETPVNLFRRTTNVTDPVYLIPAEGEALTVTIVYDVETSDPKLNSKLSDGTSGSSVENRITKEVTFNGKGLQSGYKHVLKLHLGLNSVKFDTEVVDWQPEEPAESAAWLPGNTGEGVNNPANPYTLVSANAGNTPLNLTGTAAQKYVAVGTGDSKALNITTTNNQSTADITDNGVALIGNGTAPSRGLFSALRGGTRSITGDWTTHLENVNEIAIKPMKKGTATLTMTDTNGNVSTFVIIVDAPEVSLSSTSLTLYKFVSASENGKLAATLIQANSTELEADTWATNPVSVIDPLTGEAFESGAPVSATFNNDTVTVTPNAVGSAIVKVVTSSGAEAECTVTVKEPTISVNKSVVSVKGGAAPSKTTFTVTTDPVLSDDVTLTLDPATPTGYTLSQNKNVFTLTGGNDDFDGTLKIQFTGHTNDGDPKAEVSVMVKASDPGVALENAQVRNIIAVNKNGETKAYSSVEEAHLWGATAIACIAYKGAGQADYINGLAIALSDVSATQPWYTNSEGVASNTDCTCCTDQSSAWATVSDYKNGIANTTALCNASDHNHPAALAAKNYGTTADGCSSWFLPSIGQWKLIVEGLLKKDGVEELFQYNTKPSWADANQTSYDPYKTAAMNNVLESLGVGKVQANGYWSSTEYNGTNAWSMLFNYGVTNNLNKSTNRYVRPVLAF
ncbi:MAG: hypothetical protein J6I61_10515 [Prevotella sp.]|nr:hypothetical protein [Prevotella sp.]